MITFVVATCCFAFVILTLLNKNTNFSLELMSLDSSIYRLKVTYRQQMDIVYKQYGKEYFVLIFFNYLAIRFHRRL